MVSPEQSFLTSEKVAKIAKFLDGDHNLPQGSRIEHLVFYPKSKAREDRTKLEFHLGRDSISVRTPSGLEVKTRGVIGIDQENEVVIFRFENGVTDAELRVGRDESINFSSHRK